MGIGEISNGIILQKFCLFKWKSLHSIILFMDKQITWTTYKVPLHQHIKEELIK